MRLVVSGGGTGGHIYPALMIAEHALQEEPNGACLYIGTVGGLESKIVPKTGIPFETIEISGFRRSLSIENVRTVVRFLRGVRRAKQLLREFKPDVVVGTGGYVCAPVVYAAAKMGIPTHFVSFAVPAMLFIQAIQEHLQSLQLMRTLVEKRSVSSKEHRLSLFLAEVAGRSLLTTLCLKCCL